MYQHGITVQEQKTKLLTPEMGASAIQVVVGTAPINLSENPQAAVNTLIKAKDFEDAKRKLGYCEDFKDYTLCQSMYMNLKVFGNAPVIFINVLNPEIHKKANQEAEIAVTNKQAKVKIKGILLASLVVKNGETTLEKGTNYIATFDEEGYVTLTFIGESQVLTSVKVQSDSIDPSKVQASDIVGSVDASTGAESGLELVRRVYPMYNLLPGILLAPEWSKNSTVSAALDAKSNEINGIFRCMNLVDIDTSTVKQVSQVADAKENAGLTSPNTIVLWPMYKKDGYIFSYSAAYAAMVGNLDATNGNVPCQSPSNKEILADAIVLVDGTEVNLDFEQANELNAIGVVTAIRINGWRSWGNNTASYDEEEENDPKDRWINVRRLFSWWGNRFIVDNMTKIDENAKIQQIEAIVDAENMLCNSYVSRGYCAGAQIKFCAEESDILNGKLVFEQELAGYTPIESIKNKLSYSTSMLQEAVLGGE